MLATHMQYGFRSITLKQHTQHKTHTPYLAIVSQPVVNIIVSCLISDCNSLVCSCAIQNCGTTVLGNYSITGHVT